MGCTNTKTVADYEKDVKIQKEKIKVLEGNVQILLGKIKSLKATERIESFEAPD